MSDASRREEKQSEESLGRGRAAGAGRPPAAAPDPGAPYGRPPWAVGGARGPGPAGLRGRDAGGRRHLERRPDAWPKQRVSWCHSLPRGSQGAPRGFWVCPLESGTRRSGGLVPLPAEKELGASCAGVSHVAARRWAAPSGPWKAGLAGTTEKDVPTTGPARLGPPFPHPKATRPDPVSCFGRPSSTRFIRFAFALGQQTAPPRSPFRWEKPPLPDACGSRASPFHRAFCSTV